MATRSNRIVAVTADRTIMSTPRRQKRADDFQRVAKQIYRHWRTKSLAAFEVYLYNAAYPKAAQAARREARRNEQR